MDFGGDLSVRAGVDDSPESRHCFSENPDLKHITVSYDDMLSKRTFSDILLSHYKMKCANDPENPGNSGHLWHDGPIAPEDREISRMSRAFWERKYLPKYRQACEKKGLPCLA